MIARVPIRLRLALAFTVVMAVLIAGAGAVLRWNVARNFDQVIGQNLQARASDVRSLITSDDGAPLAARGESFAQVLDQRGRVFRGTPGHEARSLLSPFQLASAREANLTIARAKVPGEENAVRLLAEPFRAQDRSFVAVVGTSLEARDQTMRNLLVLLLVGGPLGLLIASGAGYLLATAALRPVEAMRARATRISGEQPGARLPVPPARDEVRRLGETLNDMLARIDRTLARERAFVSDASHELRTPLAILKGEIEVALRPVRTGEERREALVSAAEETDRLVQLAEDLLVVARLDGGRLPVRRAPIDTAELLARVGNRFAHRVTAAGRDLRIAAPHDVAIDGDEARLEQALGNLLDNALRHANGPIELSAEQVSGGAVRLHVRDAGEGIAPEFLAEAFERFSRADAGRGRGGSGLGLAIVQAIANAHGGTAGIANLTSPSGEVGGVDAWIEIPPPPPAPRVPAETEGSPRSETVA